MTSGCVLRRCRNSYAHVNKNSGISYHTFPSNPLMKQKWICIVREERSECDWNPTTCSKICSEHFKEEDKYITYKGCIRLLKKSAVPVIPGMCISIDSFNETQSTQTRPYSNAERQKRYRERKKAEQMNACTAKDTSSESSDVQQQTQKVVINKNVDPVEHARNARKRHLNKLRQSRFRARQRFKSPTSSQQSQELVTQETCVDHDSHQDALEDHSSDPSHSTDSCSQTTLTPIREIKKDFDHLEAENEGILNIPTYVKIKQEYFEDIDSSMANLSSASSSRTMCISIDSLNETQSTQTRPYSNAERQKRYRERKKAEQMNACTAKDTSSESSDVQHQTQKVVINKNVDPVEHARNTRKRHLNKLRQSRFRARQRFKSSTSSQQAQELVTQETCVNHDSHQHASEDHSSDPSHSTDSYSQTTLTPTRKIKEEFDHLEAEDEGILNIPTYFKIKQEYLEDIDSSMADLSSASSSRTNTAYGSPTRESHIEMCLYEPQNTMDITALKEEPGSPLSDISIHSDAADCSEEKEIKNKLRKKMKMLNENEEILKRRCEEVSILENKHKELLADIKYLQNMFKKKCK